jgi:hypothetical protein
MYFLLAVKYSALTTAKRKEVSCKTKLTGSPTGLFYPDIQSCLNNGGINGMQSSKGQEDRNS